MTKQTEKRLLIDFHIFLKKKHISSSIHSNDIGYQWIADKEMGEFMDEFLKNK